MYVVGRDHRQGKVSAMVRCVFTCMAFAALAGCGADAATQSTAAGTPDSTPNSAPDSAPAAAPQVTLVPSVTTVSTGHSVTLKWSTVNARNCTGLGRLERQPVDHRRGFHGSAELDHPLHTHLHRYRRLGVTVGRGCRHRGQSQGHPDSFADDGGERWACQVVLEFDRRHGVYCVGRLARSSRRQRHLVDRYPHQRHRIRTHVLGSRWLRHTISDDLRVGGRAGGDAQRRPSTVNSGGASTLKWSTQNATACSASGAWSGSKSVSGSQSSGALTQSATYTLTCTGHSGSATQSATISVKSAPPTVALAANPSTVASGTSSTLSWNATNSTACSASGAWSGAKSASGSQSTGVLTSSKTYTLTCTGPGGSALQSTTVSVKTAAPVVTLSVGPSAVTSGGSATLTWTSTNTTSCTASGGWSGAKAVSGSQSTVR